MRLKRLMSIMLLSASAILGSACVTDGPQRSSGEIVDDTAITTKVRAVLLAEKDVNSFDIHVKTYEGIVQLDGMVESQWQIDKAIKLAAAVEGVRQVKSDMVRRSK